MSHGRNGAVDPVALQGPDIELEPVTASGPPGGPAWMHGIDLKLKGIYEIWPLGDYPEPGRPDTLGRRTRRFRYEGPAAPVDLQHYLTWSRPPNSNWLHSARTYRRGLGGHSAQENRTVALPRRLC